MQLSDKDFFLAPILYKQASQSQDDTQCQELHYIVFINFISWGLETSWYNTKFGPITFLVI